MLLHLSGKPSVAPPATQAHDLRGEVGLAGHAPVQAHGQLGIRRSFSPTYVGRKCLELLQFPARNARRPVHRAHQLGDSRVLSANCQGSI